MSGHGEGTARLPKLQPSAAENESADCIFCDGCGRVIELRPGQVRVICKQCGTVNHG